MPRFQPSWLALVFIVLAVGCAVALALMAAGELRVDSEWPGLVVGAVLVGLLIFIARR